MLAFRVIARLDVKGEHVVKGYQYEGLRVVGKPASLAKKYADDGADEIVYLNTASLYGKTNLEKILEETVAEVFVPVSVGGGIRSKEDARRLFNAGADKIVVNTAALARPALIDELAAHFGSQAVVVSIEAKRVNGGWHAFGDNGREDSGRCAMEWAAEAARRGAGELLVTSIDSDGTQAGPDMGLAAHLDRLPIPVPVVLAGGIGHGTVADAARVADAVAVGAALHYGKTTIPALKAAIGAAGKPVRL